MIIDIHNHTSRYSSCSIINPDELIKIYIKNKIDGICITEHNYLWPKKEQEELQKKYNGIIKIFFGIELSTDIGHVLVFGKNINNINLIYRFEELIQNVDRNNCILIWAHPFRWEIKKKIKINKMFLNNFDAVELYNGCLTEKQIIKTSKILKRFNINYTGGSDTHSVKMGVKYATFFNNDINNLNELINNIKYHNYYPIIL